MDPTQAFDLACHIIHALPGSDLPTFGGGTLAHLVNHHGATLIDWIEREAWRDVDFLDALSNAWVAGEDVHPTILIRLRVATGARIHIVRRPERDAAYKAMFERWIATRPQRRVRYRRKPSRVRPFAVEAEGEPSSLSALPLAPSPTSTHDLEAASPGAKASLSVRFSTLLMRLRLATLNRPRPVKYMAQGTLLVWLYWFLLTTNSPRLLLPILVVALCVISASPVADLGLVALAFVVATAGAALAGLVIGVISERRHQRPDPMASVGVISLGPYVTLLALIARSEHGVVVATAVVTGLVSRPYIGRWFRRRISRQHQGE